MPEDALLDYEVRDRYGQRVGRIAGVWRERQGGKPAFAAVRAGRLVGRSHVVPLDDASVDDAARVVQVPYASAAIRNAPTVAPDEQIGLEGARDVWDHYLRAREGEDLEIPLHGDRIDVDRSVVETGGVRLRKVVQKEVVMKPVEVLREHVIVERLRPEELDEAERRAAGRDDEIVVRERGEVPVIRREPDVIGGVSARRSLERTRGSLDVDRRVEDVEVDRQATGRERPFPPDEP